MSRLLWLPDILRSAGLAVSEEPGWKTRGADGMQPVGVIAHHTATPPWQADNTVFQLLVHGRQPPDPKPVPGPLCHLALTRTGRFHVIASGKANHAGLGTWRGYTRSISMVGIEALNWGNWKPEPTREPWPAVQYDAYTRGVAAILQHLGRPAAMLCAHREWATPPGRKPDPSGIDIDAMRQAVAAILQGEDTVPIRPGDNGPYIRPYQEALNRAGQANGIPISLTADGNFGPKTEAAVKLYQQAAGLAVTGVLDDLTRDLLDIYIPRR